jgi:hypothetical protein
MVRHYEVEYGLEDIEDPSRPADALRGTRVVGACDRISFVHLQPTPHSQLQGETPPLLSYEVLISTTLPYVYATVSTARPHAPRPYSLPHR